MKKFIGTSALVLLVGVAAHAEDRTGTVTLMMPCADNYYEFELAGVTAPWQGQTKPIRFMVKAPATTTERSKQMFSLLLTAISSGSKVGVGTFQAAGSYLSGANCGTSYVPGQEVSWLGLYR